MIYLIGLVELKPDESADRLNGILDSEEEELHRAARWLLEFCEADTI